MGLLHSEITDGIIKAFYRVYNTLGFGFLEKVYENALCHELTKMGFDIEKQRRLLVYYDDVVVGDYFADVIVVNKVIVEIKSARELNADHEAQLVNYLKATDIDVGMLLNFGIKPQFRRKVFSEIR